MMGILSPLALAYLPLAGLLVLIYLFRKKHKTVFVPSFIPWKGLRQDTLRSRSFLSDALFFLQLIALLLLVFFLTRPYLPSLSSGIIGREIIVLMDTSASMQTREGGRTRFELAQEEALKLVDGLGIGDTMQIITMHRRPHIENEMSGNKPELRKLVEGLKPIDTSSNLNEALSLGVSLLEHLDNGALHVFTDVERPGQMDSDVRFVNLAGSSRDNVAITGLDVYQDMFKEYREREAYVSLENFSDRPSTVILKSYLDEKPMTEQIIELNPREEKTIRIQDIKGSGLLKVEFTPDDALSVDNAAYAIIRYKKTLTVLVVAEEPLFVEEMKKIENATELMKFSVIPPASYRPGMAKEYDIAIFHQYVPQEYPDTNALFVFPPKENRFFPIRGWTRGASFIDWDSENPILRHLDYMGELWAYKALHLEPNEDLKTFIMAVGTEEDFPLAVSGVVKGNRVVVLGFDVADFNLSKAKNMPILIMLLNIIQWLDPHGAENYQIRTGEPFIVDLEDEQEGDEITLLTPEGETVKIDPAGNQLVITETHQSGAYVLKRGGDETWFVANLFDVEESDIGQTSSRQGQIDFKRAVASTYVEEKKKGLGRYILAAVALLLLAEWILYCMRARTAVT